MEYIEKSQQICGYKVKIWPRDAFKVTGYTLIVPPGPNGGQIIKDFWQAVIADGRLEKLYQVSSIRPWLLGLGSWDEECEKKGMRYTICIEENEQTDFSGLAKEYPLYIYPVNASEWMCFEMSEKQFEERFWQDDPYRMMKLMGYKFNGKVGIHFDAYPPEYDPEKNPNVEFWISVVKRG